MQPGNHQHLFESGRLLGLVEDLDRNGLVRLADRLLKEFVAFTGHPETSYHLALRLESRGDLPAARALLQTYLDYAPEDLEGHYLVARIADKNQDPETTRFHLGFIVSRDIGFRDAWNWYQDVRSE